MYINAIKSKIESKYQHKPRAGLLFLRHLRPLGGSRKLLLQSLAFQKSATGSFLKSLLVPSEIKLKKLLPEGSSFFNVPRAGLEPA